MALKIIAATAGTPAEDEDSTDVPSDTLDLSNISEELDLSDIDLSDLADEIEDDIDEAELSGAESALLDLIHSYLVVVPAPSEEQLVSLCQAIGIPDDQCLPIIVSLLEIRNEEHAEVVKARAQDVLQHELTSSILDQLDESSEDEEDDETDLIFDLESDDVLDVPDDSFDLVSLEDPDVIELAGADEGEAEEQVVAEDEDLEADLDDSVLDSLVQADLDGEVPSSQPEAVIVNPSVGESEEEALNKALNNDGIPNPDRSPLEPALNNDGALDIR